MGITNQFDGEGCEPGESSFGITSIFYVGYIVFLKKIVVSRMEGVVELCKRVSHERVAAWESL